MNTGARALTAYKMSYIFWLFSKALIDFSSAPHLRDTVMFGQVLQLGLLVLRKAELELEILVEGGTG